MCCTFLVEDLISYGTACLPPIFLLFLNTISKVYPYQNSMEYGGVFFHLIRNENIEVLMKTFPWYQMISENSLPPKTQTTDLCPGVLKPNISSYAKTDQRLKSLTSVLESWSPIYLLIISKTNQRLKSLPSVLESRRSPI